MYKSTTAEQLFKSANVKLSKAKRNILSSYTLITNPVIYTAFKLLVLEAIRRAFQTLPFVAIGITLQYA